MQLRHPEVNMVSSRLWPYFSAIPSLIPSHPPWILILRLSSSSMEGCRPPSSWEWGEGEGMRDTPHPHSQALSEGVSLDPELPL